MGEPHAVSWFGFPPGRVGAGEDTLRRCSGECRAAVIARSNNAPVARVRAATAHGWVSVHLFAVVDHLDFAEGVWSHWVAVSLLVHPLPRVPGGAIVDAKEDGCEPQRREIRAQAEKVLAESRLRRNGLGIVVESEWFGGRSFHCCRLGHRAGPLAWKGSFRAKSCSRGL